MPLGIEIGLIPGHIVLDGDPVPRSPAQKRGDSLQYSAYVCCGETAGWIKMPLSAEVGLGLGDIVSDGNPVPPTERGTAGLRK